MTEIVSTVTRKGQITIPRRVRLHLGIDASDQVAFVLEPEHSVRLVPARKTLESVYGSIPPLPGRPESLDFDDLIDEAMQAEADRIARGLAEE